MSGALNIYSRELDGLSNADGDIALLLATHASLALAHTQALTNAELQTAHLRKAIDSRDVIGQAKGILMQRRGITAPEAFDVLRQASQELNVKLAELASTLATRHADLDRR
jgi:AmiR/NasT family two-component response regulator